jgi:hydrogenase expression/formation protein HypE
MSADKNTGKINATGFKELLFPYCGANRNEVVTGPAYGVDVAVVDLSNGLALALTSDPLSLIPSLGLQESAWLSVHLMANDMATTGCAPMYAQFVLNLPTTLSAHEFEMYWQYIHNYCKEIGVAITGGHTGQIEGQKSTIAGGGTMLLVAAKEHIYTSNKAKPGDAIIVTKECALVSSAILAMSFPETVKNKVGAEVYNKACSLFYETSALEAGLTAAGTENKCNDIHAMHDVTECGVIGAIYEMAMASSCGVSVDINKLPVGEAQRKICGLFNIDPHYSVGAGSMIIAAPQTRAPAVINRLAAIGIKATAVGVFTESKNEMMLVENDKTSELKHPGKDPYWHAFFTALHNGWK